MSYRAKFKTPQHNRGGPLQHQNFNEQRQQQQQQQQIKDWLQQDNFFLCPNLLQVVRDRILLLRTSFFCCVSPAPDCFHQMRLSNKLLKSCYVKNIMQTFRRTFLIWVCAALFSTAPRRGSARQKYTFVSKCFEVFCLILLCGFLGCLSPRFLFAHTRAVTAVRCSKEKI